MNHLTSNPALALQMVRAHHAELSAQARQQRVRRQQPRTAFHRSRR